MSLKAEMPQLCRSLPPEGRASLARRWVLRAIGEHLPAAFEAGGFPLIAHDLALLCGPSAKKPEERFANAVAEATRIERVLGHEMATTKLGRAATTAWEALGEVVTAARQVGPNSRKLTETDLLACAEHLQKAEQLAIAAQHGPADSDRIVWFPERTRQHGDLRRLLAS